VTESGTKKKKKKKAKATYSPADTQVKGEPSICSDLKIPTVKRYKPTAAQVRLWATMWVFERIHRWQNICRGLPTPRLCADWSFYDQLERTIQGWKSDPDLPWFCDALADEPLEEDAAAIAAAAKKTAASKAAKAKKYAQAVKKQQQEEAQARKQREEEERSEKERRRREEAEGAARQKEEAAAKREHEKGVAAAKKQEEKWLREAEKIWASESEFVR